MNREHSIIFIAGIDTGIGKTVACGLLARFLLRQGRSVTTQKLAQTGCRGISSDIMIHRRIMGIPLTREDQDGTTCPYVFRFPASPHLAAARQGVRIDPKRLAATAKRLAARYEYVLVEGVGGIEVPLRGDITTLDHVAGQHYEVALVSSSRLGSINHTLLTLSAMHNRGIHVRGIVYNRPRGENKAIATDTRNVLLRALRRLDYQSVVVDLPHVGNLDKPPEIDFAPLMEVGDA